MTREEAVEALKQILPEKYSDGTWGQGGYIGRTGEALEMAIAALSAPAEIVVGGRGTTHWYECPNCGQALDPPKRPGPTVADVKAFCVGNLTRINNSTWDEHRDGQYLAYDSVIDFIEE